jgi:hypothetical protein
MTTNTANAQPNLRLSTPADVLSAVPYLLGFHPADSAVVIGLQGTSVAFQLRADLADAEPDPSVYADHLAGLVAAQGVTKALVVGYGPAERATAPMSELGAALTRRGIKALDLIRAEGGRYWSLLCVDPECCPPAGTPYDVGSTEVAAAAVVAGLVAEPTRGELARRFAAAPYEAGVAADQACDRAAARLDGLQVHPDPVAAMRAALQEALAGALAEMAAGAVPDDDVCAWLDALICVVPVRDEAWREIQGDNETIRAHLELWSHVCRRTGLAFSVAPAALAAYAAWRLGDGALAHVALDRADQVDPGYSLSQLIRQSLTSGLRASDQILDADGPPIAPLRGDQAHDADRPPVAPPRRPTRAAKKSGRSARRKAA